MAYFCGRVLGEWSQEKKCLASQRTGGIFWDNKFDFLKNLIYHDNSPTKFFFDFKKRINTKKRIGTERRR